MINYNKIISNILNYENPTKIDEIYDCLTLMKYKIDEEKIEKMDNILCILVNNGKDIYPIINSHDELVVSKLGNTMNKIINDIIIDSHHDIIISKNKDNLSDSQIQMIINKIKENIVSESYNFKRIKELLKILDILIANEIIKEYMSDTNINDSGKFENAFEIIKIYRDNLDNSEIQSYANKVLDSENEKIDILNFIYEFKECLNVDIMKKIPNAIVTIMDSNTYDKVFEIYNHNLDIIKTDEVLSDYLCNFLTIDVKNTNKVKRSFSLLKKQFKEIKNILDFIMEYLEYNKKDNENEYVKTISYYLSKESDVNQIYNDLLCKKKLNSTEIEKIESLFSDYEVYTNTSEISNEIQLSNIWCINIKNKNMKKIDLFLKECNSENVIKDCLKELSQEKIKFNKQVKKNDFYNTLMSIKSKYNSLEINNIIDTIVSNNSLISNKK